MSKRKFVHIGDIARGPADAWDYRTLVLVPGCRFDEVRLTSTRNYARPFLEPGQDWKQITDETRTAFAVAYKLPEAEGDCFFPVYLELEEDADGKTQPVSLRINLQADSAERRKAPRVHRKK